MYKSYSELGAAQEQNVDLYLVPELASSQHKNQVISGNNVVLLNIHAEWCGPCKQTAPEYSVLASKYSKPGQVAVVKYNYDKLDPNERANIHGIPVYQIYVQGRQVDEVVGADLAQVEEKLRNYVDGGGGGSGSLTKDDPGSGPYHNRSSIRAYRNPGAMPTDSVEGEPYQAGRGDQGPVYHQPYQGPPQPGMQRPQGMPQGMQRQGPPQGMPQGPPPQRQGPPQGMQKQGPPQGMPPRQWVPQQQSQVRYN